MKHHNPNYCVCCWDLFQKRGTESPRNAHGICTQLLALSAVSAPWPTEHNSPQLWICAFASLSRFRVPRFTLASPCSVPVLSPWPSQLSWARAMEQHQTHPFPNLPGQPPWSAPCKALCHVQWHQKPAHLSAMNISNGNPLDSSHAIRELNRLAAGSWHCLSFSSDIANVSLVFLHSELANQLPHFMVKFFNMVLFSST